MLRQWSESTAAQDLDGLMTPIADDVVSYEHEQPLQYVGRDAVRRSARATCTCPARSRWTTRTSPSGSRTTLRSRGAWSTCRSRSTTGRRSTAGRAAPGRSPGATAAGRWCTSTCRSRTTARRVRREPTCGRKNWPWRGRHRRYRTHRQLPAPELVQRGHQVVVLSRGRRAPYRAERAWQQVEVMTADQDAEDASGTFGGRVRTCARTWWST